jgi:putative transcriptional regulator
MRAEMEIAEESLHDEVIMGCSAHRGRIRMTRVAKKKHSALGKRLIAAAKEMVSHARGELELEEYEVRVPPQVDVIAIRKRLGCLRQSSLRRFGFSRRPVQDWEQGRRKPESAARAYPLVIAREPKAVDRALRGPRRNQVYDSGLLPST